MIGEKRKTGIDVVGDVSWGTHFCQFYQTKEDLIDILVPYFKTGLENNEFCMWVTSEPLSEKEAKEAIRRAVPDFDRYLRRRQIEIIPHTEWYLKDGAFNLQTVLNGWIDKLSQALTKGYDGIRVTGNTAWLEKRDWRNFTQYEEEVNNVIGKYQMLAICTYSLDKCGASEIVDVVSNHQFALIRKGGKWRLIESSERKQAEEALRKAEQEKAAILDSMSELVAYQDTEMRVLWANRAAGESVDLALAQLVGRHCYEIWHQRSQPCVGCPVVRVRETGQPQEAEITTPDGRVWFVRGYPIQDANGDVMGIVEVILEITERKLAEEALRESVGKYKELAESISDVFFAFDEDLRYTYWNKASEELTGIPAKDALGKHLYDIFPDVGMTRRTEKVYLKALRTKQPQHFISEYQLGGKDFFFEISAYPSKSGLSVFVKDITERKQAEEEITRLAKFPSENPNPVMRVAQNGTVLYANQAALPLLNEWRCQVGQLLPDYLSQSILEVLGSGSPKYIEVERGKQTFSFMFSPIVDAGYVNLYGRDVTERKQAEEALRESEERYRALLNLGGKVGEAIVMLQDTEQGNAIQTFVSKEWPHITGYSRKKLLGMSFFDLLHPKHREASLKRHKRKMSGEIVPGLFEMSIITKDGTEVPIELTSAYTTYQGQRANVAFIRDITERKQAEERERELQQELYLSSRLAAVGELAAGVAHEISNPLTGILGFSQRLMRKSTDKEVSRDLERIHSEAQRVAKVVGNLLTFARRREPKKEYSDINDILQQALEIRAYELETSNIEVTLDLAPSLPKTMADFPQIQEVFLNIILNAEQAMTEANGGGKLSIKTQQTRDYIRISFADDGPGIPAEQLDKIFDPFFTTRGERGGTGLGLSLCHGIVAEHAGRIYAKSKPGKGTTFFVELPLSPVGASIADIY